MFKILTLLRTSPIIRSHQIFDFKTGPDFYFIKARAVLSDNSVLIIREFISGDEIAYSYHWQTADGKIITRWDNAPHHKELRTFPHHKHCTELEESYSVNFEDILEDIRRKMNVHE